MIGKKDPAILVAGKRETMMLNPTTNGAPSTVSEATALLGLIMAHPRWLFSKPHRRMVWRMCRRIARRAVSNEDATFALLVFAVIAMELKRLLEVAR